MGTRNRPREGPDVGFTLIELLVVILIIGILSAIAIPIFLDQRTKGYEAQAKSDLRNLAEFEEVYLTDFSVYATIAQIIATEPLPKVSKGVTLSVIWYTTGGGYCLSAKHANSPVTWYWDSQNGGLQPRGTAACPVTVTGTPGDTYP